MPARKAKAVPARNTPPPPSPQVQEHLNSENVATFYGNVVKVAASDNDFKLLFGELLLGSPEKIIVKDLVQIYLNPRIGKALIQLLANAVEQYEKVHGPLNVPPGSVRTSA